MKRDDDACRNASPWAWRRLAGYRQRRRSPLSTPELAVVEYDLPVAPGSPAAGRTLLFFADLHWPTPLARLSERCAEIWRRSRPDWVVFGGDLATYACHLTAALDFLRQLPPPAITPAIAVYGNWDRRRRWFPHRQYRALLAAAGFHLLVNETCDLGGIAFHGLDDPRTGHPRPPANAAIPPLAPTGTAPLHCLVSHCVEPVIGICSRTHPFHLALCGHTHAGQVRIPGLGAIVTSSSFWKLFEYGYYRHRRLDANLIVTSGVGCSRLPLRLFCQPEIVLVHLVPATPDKSDRV